jgi:hypothetical protein
VGFFVVSERFELQIAFMSEAAEVLPEFPVETPELSVVPSPVAKPWRFDSEKARAAALKSVESKRLKKLEQAKLCLPDAVKASPASNYVAERLVQVRAQIAKLDRRILETRDAQKINWLASAVSKLQEMERILAGRPLPGQLRPKSANTRQTASEQDKKTSIQPTGAAPDIDPAS